MNKQRVANIKNALKSPEVILQKIINDEHTSKVLAEVAMSELKKAVKLLEDIK